MNDRAVKWHYVKKHQDMSFHNKQSHQAEPLPPLCFNSSHLERVKAVVPNVRGVGEQEAAAQQEVRGEGAR